jgi:hypothetical protein
MDSGNTGAAGGIPVCLPDGVHHLASRHQRDPVRLLSPGPGHRHDWFPSSVGSGRSVSVFLLYPHLLRCTLAPCRYGVPIPVGVRVQSRPHGLSTAPACRNFKSPAFGRIGLRAGCRSLVIRPSVGDFENSTACGRRRCPVQDPGCARAGPHSGPRDARARAQAMTRGRGIGPSTVSA